MTENKNLPDKVQLNSIGKFIVPLAAVFIVVIGVQYLAQDLFAPILMAVFFAILIWPLYKVFRNKGLSSSMAVFFMVVTLIVIGGGLVWFLTWSFGLLRDSLSTYVLEIKDNLYGVAANVGVDPNSVSEISSGLSPESVSQIVSGVISSLGNITVYLVFVPMLSILMLIQADSIPQDMLNNISSGSSTLDKLKQFSKSTMIYVTGRLKVNTFTGILFAISLIIIGIDFPFVWGILTIFLSFIPYIGLVIAGTPPTLIAFGKYGLTGALLVIGSIVLINIFAENILDPYIQGRGNKISTAAIVVALVFWTWLLGPVGAILSAPLTVLLKIVLSEYKETSWIAALMEGNYAKVQEKETRYSIKKLTNKATNLFSTKK